MMLLPLIVLGLTARNCKAEEMRASVLIRPDARYMWPLMVHTRGILEMTQFEPDGPVFIQGKVIGLKRNSMHGFHIHEKGNLTDGCQSTGGHYNPDGKTHGANEDDERHAGDLGNIMSDYRGCAEINISDSHFTLSGPRSIVGRSIVVHAEEDDLGKGGHPLSKKNGNAGDRWACGIIGLA